MGINPDFIVKLSVLIGAVLIIGLRGLKYSLFDPSKERTYIPLEENLKIRGKAAVDGIGGRLGKSGGAGIQQLFFIIRAKADQLSIAPYLGVLLCFFSVIWLMSARSLSGMFE